jgi:hypothetical protein
MPPAFVVALLVALPPLVHITTIAVNATSLCAWLSGRRTQQERHAGATVIQRAYCWRRTARLMLGRLEAEQY